MPTLALVGCSHIHVPLFVKMILARPDMQVRYVWDTDPRRSQHWAGQLHAQAADTIDRIWDDRAISAVVICSRTSEHPALVQAAAQSKKHLFVEKPLGMTAQEARAMAKAIDKSEVIFQTGYFNRSKGVYRYLREQVGLGHLGTISRVRGINAHAGAQNDLFAAKPDNIAEDWSWMVDLKAAGMGAMGDLSIHMLDILQWVLGEEVESVTAQVRNVLHRYGDCDDSGEAMLRFPGGALGTLAGGFVDRGNPIPFHISGTQGQAYVCNGQLFYNSTQVPGADGKQPWTNLPTDMPHTLELFLDALLDRDVPLVSVWEAAQHVAVMEAIYKSAAGGRWIKPKAMHP